MKTSSNGIQFIRDHEGCRLTAYQDGGGVWTMMEGVTKGQQITQAQADEFLASDLDPVGSCINGRVTATLNQNQFDALASEGVIAFTDSTLLEKLNAGDYRAAADNDVFVQGLYSRRVDERDLFLS